MRVTCLPCGLLSALPARCLVHCTNYNLMCWCTGKSHNATPMDPLVVARHETDARYCMYARPCSPSDVCFFLCHQMLLLMTHLMTDQLTLATDTSACCLAISLQLLHLFGQSHRHIVCCAGVHSTPCFPWPITHAVQTASICSSMMWHLSELERTSRKVSKLISQGVQCMAAYSPDIHHPHAQLKPSKVCADNAVWVI